MRRLFYCFAWVTWFPMLIFAGINRSYAARGPGPHLPHHALRLPAGCGRPDWGAHADVHQQRGQRGHRHALPAEPVPAADPRRLLLYRQHRPIRGVQEAAHAPPEPGQGGGCLLHPASPRLRDPQAHASRRFLQPDGTHRPGRRISVGPSGKVLMGFFFVHCGCPPSLIKVFFFYGCRICPHVDTLAS